MTDPPLRVSALSLTRNGLVLTVASPHYLAFVLPLLSVFELSAQPFSPTPTDRGVWVFLGDKPDAHGLHRVVWPELQELKVSPDLDLPLDPEFVREIEGLVSKVRATSRWLNAVSVQATPEQVKQLSALSFVRHTQPVGRLTHPPTTALDPVEAPSSKAGTAVQEDYGPSFDQLSTIGVTMLHGSGFRGQGIRIGLLDSGFNYRDHFAFSRLQVVAERDFINADDDASDEESEPVTGDETELVPFGNIETGQNHHGTRVLSLLGGYASGRLIGVAHEAEYILAKTEEVERELSAEEDRWIAGLEWIVDEGAQVVNSSLGWTEFDDGVGYSQGDLDGATAPATIAAEIAVARGVVVVVSAGNEGAGAWRYVTVPADGPGVIAVGSVGVLNNRIDPNSSRGPTADGRIKPDVVAPGKSVVTTTGRSASRNSERRETFALEEYERISGTSFAAPLVSGVCALLLQIHPTWTPEQIAEALRTTAADLGTAGPDTIYGWGLVDAAAASDLSFDIPTLSAGRAPFPNPVIVHATGASVFFPIQLAASDFVSAHIYDLAGNLVAEIEEIQFEAGIHEGPDRALRWEVPTGIASGLYYYRLFGSTLSQTGTLAVLRRS